MCAFKWFIAFSVTSSNILNCVFAITLGKDFFDFYDERLNIPIRT